MKNSDKLMLNQCEAILNEGLKSLDRVTRALEIIEKHKLYTDKNSSFLEYTFHKHKIDESTLKAIISYQQNRSE